jgi:hypothetical protein
MNMAKKEKRFSWQKLMPCALVFFVGASVVGIIAVAIRQNFPSAAIENTNQQNDKLLLRIRELDRMRSQIGVVDLDDTPTGRMLLRSDQGIWRFPWEDGWILKSFAYEFDSFNPRIAMAITNPHQAGSRLIIVNRDNWYDLWPENVPGSVTIKPLKWVDGKLIVEYPTYPDRPEERNLKSEYIFFPFPTTSATSTPVDGTPTPDYRFLLHVKENPNGGTIFPQMFSDRNQGRIEIADTASGTTHVLRDDPCTSFHFIGFSTPDPFSAIIGGAYFEAKRYPVKRNGPPAVCDKTALPTYETVLISLPATASSL